MKIYTNLRWTGCVLLLFAGGLFGCENKSKPTTPGSQNAVGGTQTEQAEVDSTMSITDPAFDPNAGKLITDPAKRKEAIEDVKRYKKDYPQNVSSNYFSRALVDSLLKDPRVVGIRVYRSQEKNRGRLKVVVTGVDKTGKEIPLNKETSPGVFDTDYKIGESYERCPTNCGTFDQN
ncbi:hypothetical protein [Hymenobacter sp. HDW8]|uniref:hypothetical protein n=1 Tax=Hymenobacter sp. HDW8 TaxID=2714932 RepID=UPI0014092827|nr:hypothetical protein [Hymenobacter sp. HDW8]QIL74759.1 hypothetical protein G7064_01950 [Hymenobacter sp. HDW8]